jgi:hypothetical protein
VPAIGRPAHHRVVGGVGDNTLCAFAIDGEDHDVTLRRGLAGRQVKRKVPIVRRHEYRIRNPPTNRLQKLEIAVGCRDQADLFRLVLVYPDYGNPPSIPGSVKRENEDCVLKLGNPAVLDRLGPDLDSAKALSPLKSHLFQDR